MLETVDAGLLAVPSPNWYLPHACAASPDGSLLAFGAHNTVVVCALPSLEAQAVLWGHSGRVLAVTFCRGRDGQWLVASSAADRSVRLWIKGGGRRRPAGADSSPGEREDDGGLDADASPCESRPDARAAGWHLARTVTKRPAEVTALAATEDGQTLILGDSRGGLFAWKLGEEKRPRRVGKGCAVEGGVTCLALKPGIQGSKSHPAGSRGEGGAAAARSKDGPAVGTPAAAPSPVGEAVASQAPGEAQGAGDTPSPQVSPSLALITGGSGDVAVVEWETGQVVQRLEGHRGSVQSAAWVEVWGTHVASTGGADGVVRLYRPIPIPRDPEAGSGLEPAGPAPGQRRALAPWLRLAALTPAPAGAAHKAQRRWLAATLVPPRDARGPLRIIFAKGSGELTAYHILPQGEPVEPVVCTLPDDERGWRAAPPSPGGGWRGGSAGGPRPRPLHAGPCHSRTVFQLVPAQGEDGTPRLVSSSLDRALLCWELDPPPPGPLDDPTSLPSSPGTSALVLGRAVGLGGGASALAVSPDGLVAVGVGDGTVQLVGLRERSAPSGPDCARPSRPSSAVAASRSGLWRGMPARPSALAWRPDSPGILAVGGEDGSVAALDVGARPAAAVSLGNVAGRIESLVWTSGGCLLAAASAPAGRLLSWGPWRDAAVTLATLGAPGHHGELARRNDTPTDITKDVAAVLSAAGDRRLSQVGRATPPPLVPASRGAGADSASWRRPAPASDAGGARAPPGPWLLAADGGGFGAVAALHGCSHIARVGDCSPEALPEGPSDPVSLCAASGWLFFADVRRSLWRVRGGQPRPELLFDGGSLSAPAIAPPDGPAPAVAPPEVPALAVLPPEGPAPALAADSTGCWLAVGLQDGRIAVLDLGPSSAEPAILEGHATPPTSLSWHPCEPGLLISASEDRTVRWWRFRTTGIAGGEAGGPRDSGTVETVPGRHEPRGPVPSPLSPGSSPPPTVSPPSSRPTPPPLPPPPLATPPDSPPVPSPATSQPPSPPRAPSPPPPALPRPVFGTPAGLLTRPRELSRAQTLADLVASALASLSAASCARSQLTLLEAAGADSAAKAGPGAASAWADPASARVALGNAAHEAARAAEAARKRGPRSTLSRRASALYLLSGDPSAAAAALALCGSAPGAAAPVPGAPRTGGDGATVDHGGLLALGDALYDRSRPDDIDSLTRRAAAREAAASRADRLGARTPAPEVALLALARLAAGRPVEAASALEDAGLTLDALALATAWLPPGCEEAARLHARLAADDGRGELHATQSAAHLLLAGRLAEAAARLRSAEGESAVASMIVSAIELELEQQGSREGARADDREHRGPATAATFELRARAAAELGAQGAGATDGAPAAPPRGARRVTYSADTLIALRPAAADVGEDTIPAALRAH